MKQIQLTIILSLCAGLLSGGNTFQAFKVSACGFIENKGQIIDQNNLPNQGVRFLYHSPGLNVQLRRTGFSYDVYNVKTGKRGYSDKMGAEGPALKDRIREMDTISDTFYFHRVDIELAGADPADCIMLATGPSADYYNYYTTSTPMEGVTGVRSYDTVTYSNIYPGIDLQFHMTETGGFKSDFILHPGARLSEIKYRISGSKAQVSDKGSLIFHTTMGDVEEMIPECRIVTDQGNRIFQTQFIKLEEDLYGFSTGEDIPASATVIIDPSCMRVWGTYYGGSGQEFSTTALDSRSGMVLFGGTTMSGNYIATAGTFQSSFGGTRDAFFARFTSSGQRIWGTYYGGPQYDYLYGLFIDVHNRIVVSGWTINDNIFGTLGACQEHFAGGDGDCWVARFTPEGTRLWSTYYGGLVYENSGRCTADANCNVYLAGSTASTNNISTPGAWQFNNAGNEDSFLAKFDSNGVRQWGTYFGGLSGEQSEGVSCDPAGNPYFSGETTSGNIIATTGVFQTTPGGSTDAFVEKFSPAGQRIWGTYYGGSGADFAVSLRAGDDGSVYLCGNTTSTSGIASPGAFQTIIGGALQDGFFAKLTPSGQRSWGTYYGWDGQDYLTDLSLGDNGYLFLTGFTTSTSSMTTSDSYQPSWGGGIWDGFFLKFDTTGQRDWGSYYGGNSYDDLLAIKYVTQDTIYLYGETNSTSGIATPGSFQPNVWPSSLNDEFLVQLIDCWTLSPPVIINGPVSVCEASSGITYSTPPIPHALSYEWSVPPGAVIMGMGSGTTISVNFTPIAQTGQVTVKGINKCHDAGPVLSLPVTVNPRPNSATLGGNQTPCQNVPEIYYTNSGMSNYQWSVSAGGTITSGGTPSSSSVTVVWTLTGTNWISVIFSNEFNCSLPGPITTSVTVVTGGSTLTTTPLSSTVCSGDWVNVALTSTVTNTTYTWTASASSPLISGFLPGSGNTIHQQLFNSGIASGTVTYSITTWAGGCTGGPTDYIVTVNPSSNVNVTISSSANPVCSGSAVTFTAVPLNGGATPSYQWKINEISAGSNSPVFIYTPSNGDAVKCILVSSQTSCISGNPATSNTVTMTVYNTLPVSVSISASSNPVCAGATVLYSANPFNGGISPAYLWKVNGLPAGTSSSTYSYMPQNGDVVNCQLTSSLACTSNNPATSNQVTMGISPSPSVSFSSCFDTMTTMAAKPVLLKCAIPLGGTYSGPGVNSSTGYFSPMVAGTGVKTISYTYLNASSCSDAKTLRLHVLAAPAFTCGQTLTDVRDGKSYTTVQLGSQCWMQKNLDYGAMTSAVNHQQDNCISEKYCYNDDVTNCTKYGGLYQWDELMQYQDTPGVQGGCPPGWHVPAQTEWTTLFNFYQEQALAGKPLQDTIINGFRAKVSGVIYSNASWKFQGFGAIFWTSTPSGSIKAISHGLNQINFSVSDYPANRSNAFATRCVRD